MGQVDNQVERQKLLVNGHEIYVEKYGSNDSPLIVLLHHGLGSVKAWQYQIPFLLENGYSAWVYDRWGYGNSADREKLDPPWFEDDVADLFELLKNINEKVLLIGHSDGGNIALSYTLKYPQKICGLIVVAPHIYIEPKMVSGILALQRAYQNQASFRDGLNRIHGGKAVFDRWWQSWTNLTPNWDMREKFANINIPVLVVQGERDEHATVNHALDCAKSIPNGQVWILSGAKHMLPQENAAEFNQKIITFINPLLK